MAAAPSIWAVGARGISLNETDNSTTRSKQAGSQSVRQKACQQGRKKKQDETGRYKTLYSQPQCARPSRCRHGCARENNRKKNGKCHDYPSRPVPPRPIPFPEKMVDGRVKQKSKKSGKKKTSKRRKPLSLLANHPKAIQTFPPVHSPARQSRD